MGLNGFYLVEVLVLKRFPREKNSTFFYFEKNEKRSEAGDLVEVAWRKSKVAAIVLKRDSSLLKNFSPSGEDLMIDFRRLYAKRNYFYSDIPLRVVKVRPIGKIIEKNFIQPDFLLGLKKLSEIYFVSWNHLALSTLKLPAKTRRSDFFIFEKIKSWHDLLEKIWKKEAGKKDLGIETQILTKKDFIFANYDQNREIAALIKNVGKEGKQVLILTPERYMLYALAAKYSIMTEKFATSSPVVIDSSAPPFWFRSAWGLTRWPEQKIFIGLRSSIFAPFSNLGLIILENGSSDNYKQWDLNPRFDVRRIINFLYPNVPKIYLSNSPRVEDFGEKASVLVSEEEKISAKNYILKGSVRAINKGDEESEHQAYKTVWRFDYRGKKKKIILVDSKVENRLSDCRDFLGFNFTGEIEKRHARKELIVIFAVGASDSKVGEELLKIKGIKAKDLCIVPTAGDIVSLREALKDEPGPKIVVAGKWATPILNIVRHRKTAVFFPEIDRDFFSSDFRAEEKTVGHLFNCLSFAEQIFLRTKNPEHRIFKILKRGQYLLFFQNWLKEREKFCYPPKFHLFKLIAVDTGLKNAEKKAKQLAFELEKWPTVKNIAVSLEAEKSGKRGVYWSIVVRASKDFPFVSLQRILPPGFFFDFDPETLR